jgi:hypothetical protein
VYNHSGYGARITVLRAAAYIHRLVQRGADVSLRDARGRTAADLDTLRRFPVLHQVSRRGSYASWLLFGS